MEDQLFTLALNAEELLESDVNTQNGIPTFSKDAIIKLINNNLINFGGFENCLVQS